MATRQIDFITGVETSSAPSPTTPTNSSDVISKGYADSTYAYKSSWYDKAATNAVIKAIGASLRSNGQIIFNYGTDSFYKFDSGSSATDDGSTVLQPDSGSGRWLRITSGSGGGGSDSIVQNIDTYDAGVTAGEAITSRDAVCMEIHNGTGSDVYRIFKADSDDANRRSFFGFAKSSVAVTPEISTYTISAAYVTGNVIPMTINGRVYSVNYASSSDATLQALATAISADPDVLTATVTVIGGNQTGTDDRTITITSRGARGLTFTSTTVSGGASQPTITLTETQAASGGTVDVQEIGPLAGFSGLTAGLEYYVSTTAGAITNNPAGAPIYVGRAINSTTLMVDPYRILGTDKWGANRVMIRSHGTSSTTAASNVTDSEHFNFTAWSSGTSGGVAVSRMGGAPTGYNSLHHCIDGWNTSNVPTDAFQSYNKTAWTDLTGRGSPRAHGATASFSSYLYCHAGTTGTGDFSGAGSQADRWNGSAWGSGTALAGTRYALGCFKTNSLLNLVGGTAATTHETKSSADALSSATAAPVANTSNAGANQATELGIMASMSNESSTANAYSWNGSAWSSVMTQTTSMFSSTQGGAGYDSTRALYIQNGGAAGGAPFATSQQYNSVAWSASTSSSNARASSNASVI